jgi:hypothetical protein
VDFLRSNYLNLEVSGRFDLVILIYGDFCALNPFQRQQLLAVSKGCLVPGGRMVFDVFSMALFDKLEEEAGYESEPGGGFWSADPYFLFSTRFKYRKEGVYLDRHAIVGETGCKEVFNWIQCYDPKGLRQEMARCGWELKEVLGTVAGDAYDPDQGEFGVIARPST